MEQLDVFRAMADVANVAVKLNQRGARFAMSNKSTVWKQRRAR